MTENHQEGDHKQPAPERQADRVERKSEHKASAEASGGMVEHNKTIVKEIEEKRQTRKSGATKNGFHSADSLLPLEDPNTQQDQDKTKTRFVPAGTALEIRGQKYELNQLTAQGLDVVTDATPVPSNTKTEKDIGKLSQAYGVDYSLELARQKAQQESHKRFDGKDAKTNDEFLDMFLNGSGNDRQLHTKRGDPVLEEFIKSPGVQVMREQYLKLDCPASTTKLSYGSKEAFFGTVAKPVADSAAHGFTDLFDEKHLGSVGTQVGGFGNPPKEYPWATANAVRCGTDGKPDGNGEFVQYQVTNVAGAHSWGLHAAPDRKLGDKGPYRSIVQVFSWMEPIPSQTNEKK